MRLPKTAHTSRPWRVHELTRDFELEDVWALPTPGGPDDLARLVRQLSGPSTEDPTVLRALFALRWKLGELFGWEKPGVGDLGRSLRERLPADLLESPRGPDLRSVPAREVAAGPPIFSSVYQTHDEWAAEFSNKTVHAVMHIDWVPDDSGRGYHAQMAVLVRPKGWFGKAYMTAIKPFRYALVYPLLLRSIGRDWHKQAAGSQTSGTPRVWPKLECERIIEQVGCDSRERAQRGHRASGGPPDGDSSALSSDPDRPVPSRMREAS